MASKIVEREERAYLIEDGKVVKSAASVSELLPESETQPEVTFSVGDRVEADGKLGKVVSKMNTILGEQYGVRHDDDEAFTYYSEDLTLSEAEEPTYESPVDEILASADMFEEMPADTLDQITTKLETGRALNLQARALITDSQLPLSDRVKLDAVVAGTQVDLDYLAGDKEAAQIAAYEDEQRIADTAVLLDEPNFGVSDFSTDDASWLGDVADDMEREAGERDYDTIITEAGMKLVDTMDEGLLADDDTFEEQTHNLFLAKTAGLDEDAKAEKLLSYKDTLRTARFNRLEDLKTAALEDDSDEVDDSDPSDLFL